MIVGFQFYNGGAEMLADCKIPSFGRKKTTVERNRSVGSVRSVSLDPLNAHVDLC